jgi:hypothetical protein
MSNVSKSYKVEEESKMDCFRLDYNPQEPCWGEVTVIDYIGEDDIPIFACVGHADAADDYLNKAVYVIEPAEWARGSTLTIGGEDIRDILNG